MESSTTSTTQVPFAGISMQLGDRTFIVPPLALRALRALLPRIQQLTSLGGVPSVDEMDTVRDTVLAAIQRNYPTMTAEQLEDLIDLGNMKPLMRTILGLSGLEPMKEGNAVPGTAAPLTGA